MIRSRVCPWNARATPTNAGAELTHTPLACDTHTPQLYYTVYVVASVHIIDNILFARAPIMRELTRACHYWSI